MAKEILVDYIPFEVSPQQINESMNKNGGGPIRLDISPIAWGGDGTATGDVTFVYVRVS